MLDVIEDIERHKRLRELNAKRERDDAARAAVELSDAELIGITEGDDGNDGARGDGVVGGVHQGNGGVVGGGGAGSIASNNAATSSSTTTSNAAAAKVKGKGSPVAYQEGSSTQPRFHFKSAEAKENTAEANGAGTNGAFARQNAIDESAQEAHPIDISGAIINGTESPLHVDLIWSNNKPPQLIRRPARAGVSVATRRGVADAVDPASVDAAALPQPKRRRMPRKPT